MTGLKVVQGVLGTAFCGNITQAFAGAVTWDRVPWSVVTLRKPARCYLTGRNMVRGEKAYRPLSNGHDRMLRAYAPAVEKVARDQEHARIEAAQARRIEPPLEIAHIARPVNGYIAQTEIKITKQGDEFHIETWGPRRGRVLTVLTRREWIDLTIQIEDSENRGEW